MELRDYQNIGIRIRAVRTAKGLTQEKVLSQAGLSVSHYSNIETGKTKLSLSTFIAIAKTLDVSADTLLRDVLPCKKDMFQSEFSFIFDDCTADETFIVMNTVQPLLKSLRDKRNEPKA